MLAPIRESPSAEPVALSKVGMPFLPIRSRLSDGSAVSIRKSASSSSSATARDAFADLHRKVVLELYPCDHYR
jgi:hypothetical protein